MGPEYTALHALVKDEGLHTVCQEAGCPEHLRVLGGPRGDLPHRRLAVHAPLRLLPDRHRQARRLRHAMSRAASPRASRGCGCATPRSPAWPATTCPTGARGCTPRRSAQIHAREPGHRRRDPGDRLLRRPRAAGGGLRRRARGLRAQRRDGAPHLQADPARLPLRPLARRADAWRARQGSSRSRTSSSAWARSPRRSCRRCRICTTPAPTSSRSPSTCGPRRATSRSTAGSSPRSSSSSRRRPSGSDSSACSLGPLVRSSYRAGRLWAQSMLSKGRDIPPHLAHLAQDIALEGQGTFAQAV